MSFFFFFFIPLFYLFRRSFSATGGVGIICALPLGIANMVLHISPGALVTPGGFGSFRWLSGFVDIVCLPVLVPLFVCLLLIALRALPGNVDITGFILLWLIPLSVLRSINWSSPGIPVMLVLVPVLWTALGAGIPVFISCAGRYRRWYVTVPSALGIAVLPVAAATSWWAFYCQWKFLGYLLLTAVLIPVTVWIILKGTSKNFSF
jgi:hypothetical protein